jgi:hypothetical protein
MIGMRIIRSSERSEKIQSSVRMCIIKCTGDDPSYEDSKHSSPCIICDSVTAGVEFVQYFPNEFINRNGGDEQS